MGQLKYKTQCPECAKSGADTSKDNLAVFVDGGAKCFACDYTEAREERMHSLPQQKTIKYPIEDFVIEGPKASNKRGITQETMKELGINVGTWRNRPCIAFPYINKTNKVVALKLRFLDKPKDFLFIGDVNDTMPFGYHQKRSKKRLVLCEGEFDAALVSQVLYGNTASVWSLVNGSSSISTFVEKYHQQLSEYDSIVLLMDSDDAGQQAIDKFKENKYFPIGKVAVCRLSEKDPCDMAAANKLSELKWAILDAKPEKPNGVLNIGELTPDYFKEVFTPGVGTIFPKLNKKMGGLRKGELTMVAAGTGLGKSTVVTSMIYDFVLNQQLKVVDIKLEQSQRISVYTYAAMFNNMKARDVREKEGLIKPEEFQVFIEKFQTLWVHDHFGSLDSLKLLDMLEYYASVLKVDFIFLDHISIAVSGTESSKDGERKDIDKLVTRIRELIHRTGVGFVCVSHLSNPRNDGLRWEQGKTISRSDLRGSGTLGQLSDNIIGIEGNLTSDGSKHIRKLKLIKTRYGDEQEAYCDQFTFNVDTSKIELIDGDNLI